MSPNNPDPASIQDCSTRISGAGRRQSLIEVTRNGVLDSAHVVYKAEWYHRASGLHRTVQISSPSDLKITQKSVKVQKVQKPVLEVITTIHAREDNTGAATKATHGRLDADVEDKPSVSGPQPGRDIDLEPEETHTSVRGLLDEVEISKIGTTRIIIHSPTLLNVIRRYIDYYPHQDLTGDSITIVEPYMCLIHHYDVLEKSALPCEGGTPDLPCKLHSHMSLCDKETKRHVQVLLDFLAPTMESNIVPALEKLKREVPVVTFDTVWLLFQPGTEIYEDFTNLPKSGFLLATVVLETEYKRLDEETDPEQPMSLMIRSWFMCSNGENVGRSTSRTWIPHFEGEKEVTQLPAYPCSYGDPHLRTSFTSRGKIAHKLFKDRNKAIFFDGSVYSHKKAREVSAFSIAFDT